MSVTGKKGPRREASLTAKRFGKRTMAAVEMPLDDPPLYAIDTVEIDNLAFNCQSSLARMQIEPGALGGSSASRDLALPAAAAAGTGGADAQCEPIGGAVGGGGAGAPADSSFAEDLGGPGCDAGASASEPVAAESESDAFLRSVHAALAGEDDTKRQRFLDAMVGFHSGS